MKPALLRMLLENTVFNCVPSTSKAPAGAVSSRSTRMAVHTSPKMKWQSRSFQARCGEVISGFTTSTARAEPHLTAFTAISMPKVADEQATFMSKPKPLMPSAC